MWEKEVNVPTERKKRYFTSVHDISNIFIIGGPFTPFRTIIHWKRILFLVEIPFFLALARSLAFNWVGNILLYTYLHTKHFPTEGRNFLIEVNDMEGAAEKISKQQWVRKRERDDDDDE